MPSHNLAHIKIDNLEIVGYSVAGEETVVAMPQLDVCFDIGKAPDQIIPINHILLTHGHMDHAAGLAYYLSHRNFCGMSPGTILAPQNLLEPIKEIIDAWGRLDGNKVPANLVGVKAGDEYQIKPNLIARVFPTKHSKGSVGFSVIEKRKKLKPEYNNLTGPQIVELKKEGIEILAEFGDDPALDKEIISRLPAVKFLARNMTEPLPPLMSDKIHVFIRFTSGYAVVRLAGRSPASFSFPRRRPAAVCPSRKMDCRPRPQAFPGAVPD